MRQALYDGESYELCLTTALTAEQQVPALSLYHTLRQLNPAPYAAWLAFGDELQVHTGEPCELSMTTFCLTVWCLGMYSESGNAHKPHHVQVCCSSPERFLRGGRGRTLEAKPIKGTARRILGDAAADAVAAAALAASEKVRQIIDPSATQCVPPEGLYATSLDQNLLLICCSVFPGSRRELDDR